MWQNYLKIALRNLSKNKAYSAINIGGLAVGMSVAMLIGLWIWDEVSFNKCHQHYERVAQVMQHTTYNGERQSLPYMPFHLANIIRNEYGTNFKQVVMSTFPMEQVLAVGDKKFTKKGNYMDPAAPELLSLHLRQGTGEGLRDPASILLSASVARAFFGDSDPLGKTMKLGNQRDVTVKGVYDDLPDNSDFKELSFIAPWQLFLHNAPGIATIPNPWDNNSFQVFVQLADRVDIDKASAAIKDIRSKQIGAQEAALIQPALFLHPMSKWHLYSEFKDGLNTGGRIQQVWLFGIISLFVLLLACINFMNLSTARSEKRAKEVGIRKAIGSFRAQLMSQFFSESLLVSSVSFVFSLGLVLLLLPALNNVTDKHITMPWASPLFWVSGLVFSILTGLVAGLYPALYLSSFQAVKVLKGTFRAGRFATAPRKAMLVLQFSVSIMLIIGTIVVVRQVQSAKDRPLGFQSKGLVTLPLSLEVLQHFEALRSELKASGAIVEMAASTNPLTGPYNMSDSQFDWKGKDPLQMTEVPISAITPEYGSTVGWQIKDGRDFSKEFASDSAAFIINEAAVRQLGLQNPIGETIRWRGKAYTVVGVIKDIVFGSPYQSIRPYFYFMDENQTYIVTLKLNPAHSVSNSLATCEAIFNKFDPAMPFDYAFVDEAFAKAFGEEVRIGKLASFFALLAIFINCLGLFGMASFMAGQRTKEIGVRKVLGASVLSVWHLLSKEFVGLVFLACLIATPIAYYYLNGWLQRYEYRTEMSVWIFVVAGLGALAITLLTVSYQAVKAALANPVKSLRSE